MQNRVNCVTAEQKRVMRVHRRFYGALVLNDLCNEVPMADVSRRYKVHKGLLQSLQNSAATYAGFLQFLLFCLIIIIQALRRCRNAIYSPYAMKKFLFSRKNGLIITIFTTSIIFIGPLDAFSGDFSVNTLFLGPLNVFNIWKLST